MRISRKKGKFKKVSITLREDQIKWIERKRKEGFNLSQFVQRCIDREMYVEVRIVRITGGLNPKGLKVGQKIRLTKEEYERLPKTKWGKYIPADNGVKYYIKPVC